MPASMEESVRVLQGRLAVRRTSGEVEGKVSSISLRFRLGVEIDC